MMIHVVQFPNGREARIVRTSRSTSPGEIVDALQLPAPRSLLVLNGSTRDLSSKIKTQLGRLLQDGLARTSAEEHITLISGGTDAGVFSLFGQGIAKWDRTEACIGVTVLKRVTWPGRLRAAQGNARRVPLEPHHSHFILVSGANWGDETETMYAVSDYMSCRCPSVAVFVGGGSIAIEEMLANARHGRKMLFVAGSGRATDLVLGVLAGETTTDVRVKEIAEKASIVAFPVDQTSTTFSKLIRRSLLADEEVCRGD